MHTWQPSADQRAGAGQPEATARAGDDGDLAAAGRDPSAAAQRVRSPARKSSTLASKRLRALEVRQVAGAGDADQRGVGQRARRSPRSRPAASARPRRRRRTSVGTVIAGSSGVESGRSIIRRIASRMPCGDCRLIEPAHGLLGVGVLLARGRAEQLRHHLAGHALRPLALEQRQHRLAAGPALERIGAGAGIGEDERRAPAPACGASPRTRRSRPSTARRAPPARRRPRAPEPATSSA